jgi:CelD/BcsL family acetyltransferase involved in cellulose biosynthesis
MPNDLAAGCTAGPPGVDALAALDPVWRAVEAGSGTDSVFLTPAWQRAWWRHFGRGRPLRVTVLPSASARSQGEPRSQGGPPAALAPFFEDRGVLRLVGAPEGPIDVADYLDILAVAGREAEAWEALAAWLAGEAGVARAVLDNVPDGSPSLTLAPPALARAGLALSVEEQGRCPVITLPADFDTYLAGLDRGARHELRRKVRRFEREAPGSSVRFLRRGEAVAALPEFVTLHRLSGAEKARFMTPAMEGFFDDMAASLAAEDRLVLARLADADNRPLAAMCLFDYRGGWYLYNSGYDPAAARLAPGLVLLARSIEAACQAGVGVFDFLRGTERYKYDLGGRDRVVRRMTIERGGP